MSCKFSHLGFWQMWMKCLDVDGQSLCGYLEFVWLHGIMWNLRGYMKCVWLHALLTLVSAFLQVRHFKPFISDFFFEYIHF